MALLFLHLCASKDMYYALRDLIRVAQETTKDLIGFDGANELDAAIDKATAALNKAVPNT